MNQEPIVKKGTNMDASGHVATVVSISRAGVNCVLDNGRSVTISHKHVEQAVK